MELKSLKNLNFIIPSAIAGVLLIACIFLLGQHSRLSSQVSQSKKLLSKMEEEVKNAVLEKENLAKEKEKLQADAISYIGINTNLQREKEEAEKKLKGALEIINTKEQNLASANKKLTKLSKQLDKEKNAQGRSNEVLAEKGALQAKIKSLEDTLKKERGSYHYNLAVSYTQAKLYDEAVDAYKKSLEFEPSNPEAYYNLGLVYENFKADPDEAISCYKKYLELKPDALDKEEVEGWISRLQ